MHGLAVRPRNRAAKLRWERGKGDDVPAKVARVVQRNRLLELSPEARFRRTLRAALEELELGAEIVVGDASWAILPGREVDIPVILIDPVSQRFCRVGVEVDGAYFHRGNRAKRDAQKSWMLRNRGWAIVRVNADRVESRTVAWEVAAEIAEFFRATVNPTKPVDQA